MTRTSMEAVTEMRKIAGTFTRRVEVTVRLYPHELHDFSDYLEKIYRKRGEEEDG